MKLGELRALLANVPDDADINFADGNFGGRGDDLDSFAVVINPAKGEVLLRPPYWEAVD